MTEPAFFSSSFFGVRRQMFGEFQRIILFLPEKVLWWKCVSIIISGVIGVRRGVGGGLLETWMESICFCIKSAEKYKI